MVSHDIEKFREQLLALRQQYLSGEAQAEASGQVVELDQSKVGRLSRMDALQSQAMSHETNRRRQLAITRIDAALQRIDAGEYGYCLACDEPISPGRLSVDPMASLCLQCAESRE